MRLAAQRGRRRGDAVRRPPPLRRLLRREGHVPLPRPRARRAGHASMPAIGRQRAAQARARAASASAPAAPAYDVVDEPRALLQRPRRGPGRPGARGRRASARREPRARGARRADARRHVRADDHRARAREDQRDPRARRVRASTAGSRPAWATTSRSRRAHELLGDARDGLELDWTEGSSATARRSASPLMDAIADWVGEADPGAEAVPIDAARLHRLALVPRRVPGLRRLRLLPAAPPDPVRVLAADARRRRAHRRARPRLRRRILRRPAEEAA